MLFSLVTKFIYVSLLAALPTTAVAAALQRRGRMPGPIIPIIAMGSFCLIGYGAFWAFFAAVWLGKLFLGLVYLASAVYLLRVRQVLPKLLWRECEMRTVWILMLLIGCSYLAILCAQYKDGDGLVLPAHRWSDLPSDNLIPVFFADSVEHGYSIHGFFGDWLSSDRPPLQTGVILLLRPPLVALGLNHIAVAASQWFQLLWLAGLWALVRTLGAKPKIAAVVVAITACTGFGLLHSVYTWPKLGAAAMIFGGVSLLLSQNIEATRERWAYSAGFFALAHLSHGGADFSILALAPFLCWQRWRPDMVSFLMGSAVFVVLVAPWMAYQKYYEPPGDRLLKWHLAGVIDIDKRPFSQALVDSYREIGWKGAWHNKQANFGKLVAGNFSQIFDFSMREERAGIRRGDEFFWTFRALAFGNISLLALPFTLWLLRRKSSTSLAFHETLLCLGWLALTLIFWCLLMFIAGATAIHQGSLVTPVALFALPMLLVLMCSWRWFLPLALMQIVAFVSTWWPAMPGTTGGTSIGALVILILCVCGLLWYIISMRENESEAALILPSRHPGV